MQFNSMVNFYTTLIMSPLFAAMDGKTGGDFVNWNEAA